MKRVLVVMNKLLLGVGLESLLSRERDLVVKSIAYINKKSLTAEIRRFEPEVVLVDESARLTRPINLLEVLEGFPNIRVLIVDTKENLIQVYNKREIQITRSLDFISVVKNE